MNTVGAARENVPPTALQTPSRPRRRDLVSPAVSRIPRPLHTETPRSRLPQPSIFTTPQSSRPRISYTPQSARVPRQSTGRVLEETLRENIAIQRQKTTEARLEDIQHEKYEVQNERDDLRTELHLSRQRELRLKATIEKHEHVIARYRARAQENKEPPPKDGIRRGELCRLRERADHDAARIVELEREIQELHEENEYATASGARNVCAVTVCASRMRQQEKDRHAKEIWELQTRLARAERAQRASESRAAALEADVEHYAGLYSAALEQIDSLRTSLAETNADAAELCSRWLDAENAWNTARESEESAEYSALAAELQDTRVRHLAQEYDMQQLVEELDRVSWYQEAYEERCQQVRLLAQVAKLAEDRENELTRVNAELLAQDLSPRSKSRVAEIRGNMNQLVAMRLERDQLAHRITRLEQELTTYRTVVPNGARTRAPASCESGAYE
ncbi:hypothetical protein MCUN1_003369 [Malassezia cuniculi]|uniref:Uncharacterized protein n=1 Tax=Malassezia cuniculi TaxID=948313 RepID=A0AAF0EWM3_9BASI|nr:hypothetical protein MCUN1_003369 [Malassezia cuniculi]